MKAKRSGQGETDSKKKQYSKPEIKVKPTPGGVTTKVVAQKAPKGKEKKDEQITLLAMDIRRVVIPIVGISQLIVNNWSQKSLQMIRDTQQKKAKTAREAKNPEADFEAAKYKNENGEDCVPAGAFKNAIVAAARYNDAKMTVLRGALFVVGDLIPIEFETCTMREDPVRVGMGKTDLRYRPGYSGWSVDLTIEYNANVISIEQLINLVKLAGFSVGICEWRPEKNGQFGRFEIATENLTETSRS